MQINSINYNNSPQFKQINRIKVPKNIFHNCEKHFECLEIFDKKLGELVGEKPLTSLQKTLAKDGYVQPIKFLSIIESPGFVNILDFMEKKGFKNLGWLENFTGLKMNKPLSEEHHSFYVLTDADITNYFIHLGSKAEWDCFFKGYYAIKNDNGENAVAKGYVLMAKFLDEIFEKLINNKPIKEFEIKSFEDLNSLIKKLNI